MLIDGIEYKKTFLTHDALVYGKTIVFRMDSEPKAGSSKDSTPPAKPLRQQNASKGSPRVNSGQAPSNPPESDSGDKK
jgi:hypothetical protein